LVALNHDDLDVTDGDVVSKTIETLHPVLVINAAGYTAVDKAEEERDLAFAVNSEGARHLARAARGSEARMIHVSTDFVFDGEQGRPYRPDDEPNPLGTYGASKLEGERAATRELGDALLILRTAWVYSEHGHNFVKTMLRLMRERDTLRVVADQAGTPTWGNGLAQALWGAAHLGLTGVHHWTDAGVASWYDFAVAIQEEASAMGLLETAIPIDPISAAEYPTPAQRPAYSVLDKTDTWRALGYKSAHWRIALREMLCQLKDLNQT
jgi:dTDP-4-dehydrorhamnose reductase